MPRGLKLSEPRARRVSRGRPCGEHQQRHAALSRPRDPGKCGPRIAGLVGLPWLDV